MIDLNEPIIDKLLGFISNSSQENIRDAIDNNVDLSEILLSKYKGYLFLAKMFKHEYEDEIRNITYEDVLSVLYTKRPDLYKVIVSYPNGKGIKWLEMNTNNLKFILL